jgi:5-oxopent-3-ene-1,2,5-tricarboxylate decarboxylase/2-hydroxyhepta-2,4-diene-1,7-dioate isomerase
MICNGHIYGTVLNDKEELSRLAPAFADKPYLASPIAPVVYMRPAATLASGPVRVKPGSRVVAAATVALLFARDAARVDAADAMDCVGASALAIDLSYPQADYYRPAIAQRNADGFLVLGERGSPVLPEQITTSVDGKDVHNWSLDRLARPVPQMIADITAFLTLRAGDVLLVGLPGDAPSVGAGARLRVQGDGMAPATAQTVELAS